MGNDTGNSENEKLNIYYFIKHEQYEKANNIKQNNRKEKVKQLNFENTDLYNWIQSGEEIEEKNFSSLIDKIKINLQKKPDNNCILIFFDSDDYNDKKGIMAKYLDKTLKVYKPIIILAFNEKNKKEINNSNKNEYEIVFYKEDDYTEINEKIKLVYNYYFNIGDHGMINLIQILDDFTYINKKKEHKENIFKNKTTFNILVMGRAGCGKSTLINLLLEEQRAREGIGYSITKLYSQYVHKKYPITFTDTTGFEDNKSLNKMKNFLSIYNEFFNEGKSKFHLVLYLINAGSERTFTKTELDLIYDIRNKYNIPILFVCTHSRNDEDSEEFKEAVKISLIQYLESKAKEEKEELIKKISEERNDSTNQDHTNQTDSDNQGQTEENILINPTTKNPDSTLKNLEDKHELNKKFIKEEERKLNIRNQEEKTKLIDRIYCCHLINEKDGKYKRFGIDKILSGIKNIFENSSKECLSNQEKKNREKKPAFDIMKSLDNTKSFSEYLKNLSFKICDKYFEKISKTIKEDNTDFYSKIEKLYDLLENHLSIELNCAPFDIYKNDEKGGTESHTNDKKLGIFNLNEMKQKENKIKENINKIINDKVNNIDKIESDRKKVMESYENVINYFEEMIKKFKLP